MLLCHMFVLKGGTACSRAPAVPFHTERQRERERERGRQTDRDTSGGVRVRGEEEGVDTGNTVTEEFLIHRQLRSHSKNR